ncbi:MAG: hypothetical protein KTR18_10015 [Acidiferrobacterales bacterium]|nr:hypothetical protein [Acidiferrobacterales bacterium]
MNKSPFPHAFQPTKLVNTANEVLGDWVRVEQHSWKSLYAWQSGTLYDDYGDPIGEISANTVYLYELSLAPHEDLFHELGHAIAREFDFIGHRTNGFSGSWEKRQARLIAQIQHDRHWSESLKNIWQSKQHEGDTSPSSLGSEIWAELFMYWYFYSERPEVSLIRSEMESISHTPQLTSIGLLYAKLGSLEQIPK